MLKWTLRKNADRAFSSSETQAIYHFYKKWFGFRLSRACPRNVGVTFNRQTYDSLWLQRIFMSWANWVPEGKVIPGLSGQLMPPHIQTWRALTGLLCRTLRPETELSAHYFEIVVNMCTQQEWGLSPPPPQVTSRVQAGPWLEFLTPAHRHRIENDKTQRNSLSSFTCKSHSGFSLWRWRKLLHSV